MALLSDLLNSIVLVRKHANITLASIILITVQLVVVTFCSLTTPLLIRRLLSVPFAELNVPLEFTFHTCTDQLHGICSFPEAEVVFDEQNIMFEGGYRYKFTLDMELSELELLRATGLFLTQIELKDERSETLVTMKKTVRIVGAGFYGWYIWLRNWLFLPLYIVGLIGDGNLNHVLIEFPSDFQEAFSRPTKFLTVQVQNRFIQVRLFLFLNTFLKVSSASLRIRASIGLLVYVITNYPLITYAFLSGLSFLTFLTFLAIYWTSQGLQMYQRIKNNIKTPQNSRLNKDHQF